MAGGHSGGHGTRMPACRPRKKWRQRRGPRPIGNRSNSKHHSHCHAVNLSNKWAQILLSHLPLSHSNPCGHQWEATARVPSIRMGANRHHPKGSAGDEPGCSGSGAPSTPSSCQCSIQLLLFFAFFRSVGSSILPGFSGKLLLFELR